MGAGLSEPVLVTETAYHAAVHDPDGKWPGASPRKEPTPDFFASRGSPASVLDPDGKWPCASPRKALTDASDAPSRGSCSPSGFVTVHDDAWDTYREDFIIQVRGFAGFDFWQGVRSRDDFERLCQAFHKDMGASALNALAPLPRRPDFIQMSPWKWACYLRDTRSGLQGWLDGAIETNLCDCKLWRSFFLCQPTLGVAQLPSADAWHDLSHAVLGLPTMISIMSFLEEPSDVARLCYFSAGWIRHASESFCPKQWETWFDFRSTGRSQHQTHCIKDILCLWLFGAGRIIALRTGFVNDITISFLYRGLVCSHLCRNGNMCDTVQLSSEETMYADRWPAFYEAQKYVSQLSHSEVDWKSMCLGLKMRAWEPEVGSVEWSCCFWIQVFRTRVTIGILKLFGKLMYAGL